MYEASKFTDAQKAFIVTQGEAGMKRLRELEHENSRLKKFVADLVLDKEKPRCWIRPLR